MLRFQMLLTACISLMKSCASQATDCSCSVATDKLRYHGLHLNVLANGLERTDFEKVVNKWKMQTGATINIEFAPQHDMLRAAMSDKNRGSANYYDVYTLDNRHLPEFAELGYAMDITQAVTGGQKPCETCTATKWTDIASFVRSTLSKHGQSIYGVPLDGDTFQLYFRRDVFSEPAAFLPTGTVVPSDLLVPGQTQMRVPSTWDEYVRIAELFRGVDLNNDGVPDFGNCMPIKGSEAFYWLAAPLVGLVQHRTEVPGAFFKLSGNGIEPLVKNAAFTHVMEMLKSLHKKSGSADDPATLSWDSVKSEEAFGDGRCLMYLSWPSTSSQGMKKTGFNGTYAYQHGRMGVAPLPGWNKYFDQGLNSLEPCTTQSCPFVGANGYPDGVNAVAFMARGGMTGVVNNDRPDRSREAALDLLVYLSNNLGVTSSTLFNAYRTSQLDIRSFLRSNWDAVDAAEFIAATDRTFKHPLQVLDMRIVEDGFGVFALYQQALEDVLLGRQSISTVQSDLHDKIDALIKKVDEDSGRDRFFENIYRKSLGLPARIDIQPTDDYTGLEFLPWALSVTIVFMVVAPAVFYYFRTKVSHYMVILLNADMNETAFDVLAMVFSIVQFGANVLGYLDICGRAKLAEKYQTPFLGLLVMSGCSVLMSGLVTMYAITHMTKKVRTTRRISRDEYTKELRNLLHTSYHKAELGIANAILSAVQDIPMMVILTQIWVTEDSLGLVLQSCFCATLGSFGVKVSLGKEAVATVKLHSTLSHVADKLEGQAKRPSVLSQKATDLFLYARACCWKLNCCPFFSRCDPDIENELDSHERARSQGFSEDNVVEIADADDVLVLASPDASQVSETSGWIRPDLANASKYKETQQQALCFNESVFQEVPVACSDGTKTMGMWFVEDKDARKVNLCLGAYSTEDGRIWTSPTVLAARLDRFAHGDDDKYVPIDGDTEHKKSAQRLVFSEDEVGRGTIATTLCTPGTESLSIVSQFLANFMGCKRIHVSNTSWGHHNILLKKNGLDVKMYPYYRPTTRALDLDKMLEALMKMSSGDAVLLQACAHDPTGVDPSDKQWQRIVDVCKVRGIIPVLDNAYQGSVSGNPETDGLSMRLFEWAGVEFFVLQSFVNTLGFFSDHVGYIHIRCKSAQVAGPVLSQLKALVRQTEASPPKDGAAVVHTLLSTPEWKAQWLGELEEISQRLLCMRAALRAAIEEEEAPGTWNHITDQVGMFSYTGLTMLQVDRMLNQFHVYMTRDGRISISALNNRNVGYVGKCIAAVVRAGC